MSKQQRRHFSPQDKLAVVKRHLQQLEAKLQRKNEVMAELMEAHTQLKKELGEL